MKIIGIYKLPQVKHIFFIVSELHVFDDLQESMLESKRRMEYFEHILRCKDYMPPKAIPRWRLKVMTQNDLLTVLAQHNTKEKSSSNLTFQSPEEMEMLAINLFGSCNDENSCSYKTSKNAGVLYDDDIIEVFI